MRVRFDWPKEDWPLNDNIWASAAFPGAMVGGIIGWKVMQRGRRITLYLTTCISAICICLLVIENQWAILAGRLFLGFAVAFLNISSARFLEEVTPIHLYSTVLTILGFIQNGVQAATMILA